MFMHGEMSGGPLRSLGGGLALASKPPVRFAALDSWRGIAAVLVVLYHAPIVSHLADWRIVQSGYVFVDFFFVLSGFVVAHAYLDRIRTSAALKRFLVLRVGRLYPLHLFMLLLFLGFECLRAAIPGLGSGSPPFGDGFTMPSFSVNLLMLQGFWPLDHLTWNAPSWSISAEMAVYLLFGIAVLTVRSRLVVVLVVAAATASLVLALFSAKGMATAAGLGWPRAVYGFALGAALYRLTGSRILFEKRLAPENPHWRWSAAELLALLGTCAVAVYTAHTPLAYLVTPVFAVAVAVFAVEGGLISRLLTLRPILLIGTLSYSIYLTHLFILSRFGNAARIAGKVLDVDAMRQVSDLPAGPAMAIDFGNLWINDAVLAAMLVCVAAASWLTYTFVELPGQRLARRWSRNTPERGIETVPDPGVIVAHEKGRLREAAL